MNSPSQKLKQIQSHVRLAVREMDLSHLAKERINLIRDLQQNLADTRIYLNAYELAEAQQEQREAAKWAKKWLTAAHKNILVASEYNLFSAIDVAHLSAQIEQLQDKLT